MDKSERWMMWDVDVIMLENVKEMLGSENEGEEKVEL